MSAEEPQISLEEARANIRAYCTTPERVEVLKKVRKERHYKETAKLAGVNQSNASTFLNQMKALRLVTGKNGRYKQTRLVRTIRIDSVISGNQSRARIAPQTPAKTRKVKIKVLDVEGALDNLDIERVVKKDCFPLRKPYRLSVGEAYLTLENVMKNELNITSSTGMMDVITHARNKGLFKRPVRAEEEGLSQLFNASAMWLRNPAHHYKTDMPKSDALKMILFADYLIKLVRIQKKLNKIQ